MLRKLACKIFGHKFNVIKQPIDFTRFVSCSGLEGRLYHYTCIRCGYKYELAQIEIKETGKYFNVDDVPRWLKE